MSQELYLTERLFDQLSTILSFQEGLVSQLEALRDSIARNRDVTRSAVQLLQGLAEKLKEVRSPEDLSALIAEVEADTNELASAVAANTPVFQGEPHAPPAEEVPVTPPADPVPEQEVQPEPSPPNEDPNTPSPPVEEPPSE